MNELGEAGKALQVGVGDALGVGEREATQRGDILDEGDGGAGFEAFAELQILERQFGDVLQGLGRRLGSADFEAFEFRELGEMWGAGVGELGMREAEALEVRQVIAQLA